MTAVAAFTVSLLSACTGGERGTAGMPDQGTRLATRAARPPTPTPSTDRGEFGRPASPNGVRSTVPSQYSPFVVGGRWRCPDGVQALVLAGENVYRPTNFPGLERGATRRPDRCFTLTQDAQAAGYKLALPPRGVSVVGGAYLVPVTAATRALCRAAAARLREVVPCPGILPTTSNLLTCTDQCVSGSVFTLEFSGFLTVDSAPSSPTHAYIMGTARPGDYIRQFCDRGYVDPPRSAGRRAGYTITCPAGSALNSGHVIAWTLHGRVAGGVSIHGTTPANTRLARAIADRLGWMAP